MILAYLMLLLFENRNMKLKYVISSNYTIQCTIIVLMHFHQRIPCCKVDVKVSEDLP